MYVFTTYAQVIYARHHICMLKTHHIVDAVGEHPAQVAVVIGVHGLDVLVVYGQVEEMFVHRQREVCIEKLLVPKSLQ